MPIVGWYDSATGLTRPFGTELEWTDCPVGPEMLIEIAAKVTSDTRHMFDVITPTTLISTPRQVIIERFMDYTLDPEEAVSQQMGLIAHETLTKRLADMGYMTELTEDPVEIDLFGLKMTGSPDAWWPPDRKKPRPEMPDVVELKITTSGSMKFIIEDGCAKKDHVAQAAMYGIGLGQMYGVPADRLTKEIRYYAMPQKERSYGNTWVRTPPCIKMPAESLDELAIGLVHPGYSPPTRPTHYQGPPPPTIRENADTLKVVMQMLRDGRPPLEVVNSLPCYCDRRFNGQGRAYCGMMRDCAMADHGTPMW